jgi:flagellin-like protein
MNKKGITPVIAVILLLMMTVAAAGAAFFWFVRIQSEMQGGTESYQQELGEKVSANVEVVATQLSAANLKIYLKNNGNVNVPLDASTNKPTTNWLLFDANSNIICSSDWNSGPAACAACATDASLEIGEIQEVILALTDPCDDITDSTYNNGTMFSYMIDFSGVTGTGGTFTK